MRLEIREINQRFGLDYALRRLSLQLRAGACHTLLGPHGSGKSSLADILSGAAAPESGELLLDGHRYAPRHQRDARVAGVAALPPSLPGELTVEEALLLGFEPGRLGCISRARRHEAARRALASLRSSDIPLTLPLHALPENQRRRVALARTLMGQPRLVVLDEPAPLPDYDLQSLLLRLRDLAQSGSSILLLTRSPDLARALGGPISLLRNGMLEPPLAALPAQISWSAPELPARRIRPRRGPVLLALHEVMNSDWQAPLSLTLREGELLGLAGTPGAGRRALLRLIAGLAPVETGAIHLSGRAITRRTAPERARRGILYAEPSDTHLFPDCTVAENLFLTRIGRRRALAQWRSMGRCGFYPPEELAAGALDWMEKLAIRPGRPSQAARELSHANRQKVILGRQLQRRGSLFLFDHGPFGAELPIYGWLSEMAAEGRGVIIAGPDPEALLGYCDTIIALRRGRLVESRPAADWSLESLTAALTLPPA